MGWTVRLKCPHGVEHEGPLDALVYGAQSLKDMCAQARMERAMLPPRLSRKEKRKFRRLARNLGSIAPNVDSPPSSETKEPL